MIFFSWYVFSAGTFAVLVALLCWYVCRAGAFVLLVRLQVCFHHDLSSSIIKTSPDKNTRQKTTLYIQYSCNQLCLMLVELRTDFPFQDQGFLAGVGTAVVLDRCMFPRHFQCRTRTCNTFRTAGLVFSSSCLALTSAVSGLFLTVSDVESDRFGDKVPVAVFSEVPEVWKTFAGLRNQGSHGCKNWENCCMLCVEVLTGCLQVDQGVLLCGKLWICWGLVLFFRPGQLHTNELVGSK